MSKLLFDENPLMIDKSLAVAIGLDEAIVLQQIHYWLKHNEEKNKTEVYKDGRWWSYCTINEWKDNNFPFWGTDKIKKILMSLKNKGFVTAANLNSNKWKKTLWYTINYEQIDQLAAQKHSSKVPNGTIEEMVVEPTGSTRDYTKRLDKENSSSITNETPKEEMTDEELDRLVKIRQARFQELTKGQGKGQSQYLDEDDY